MRPSRAAPLSVDEVNGHEASPRVIIGTSGWQYADWKSVFYPPEARGKAQLGYYASHFESVEINSTFYHVPRLSTVENWAASVPDDFRFAIKLNRFLTHSKRLATDTEFGERLRVFLELLQPLGDKLAVILVQLPPSLRAEPGRLEYLAEQTKAAEQEFGRQFPLAIEFRHASWFNDETYALMAKYNLANVINDSPGRWPASRAVTANFAYIRFHGSKQLYRSSYTDQELTRWVDFIRTDCAGCQQVFCYFNNDYNAVAVQNAKTLKRLILQYRKTTS